MVGRGPYYDYYAPGYGYGYGWNPGGSLPAPGYAPVPGYAPAPATRVAIKPAPRMSPIAWSASAPTIRFRAPIWAATAAVIRVRCDAAGAAPLAPVARRGPAGADAGGPRSGSPRPARYPAFEPASAVKASRVRRYLPHSGLVTWPGDARPAFRARCVTSTVTGRGSPSIAPGTTAFTQTSKPRPATRRGRETATSTGMARK